jgi:hypothetical protein
LNFFNHSNVIAYVKDEKVEIRFESFFFYEKTVLDYHWHMPTPMPNFVHDDILFFEGPKTIPKFFGLSTAKCHGTWIVGHAI